MATPWAKRLVRLALAAGLVGALACGAIFALFAVGGMARVDARASTPDGAIEARAERQGGSMQFPSTSIHVRRKDGWFARDTPDCVAVRWSAKGSGRESGAVRAVTLQWRDDRSLLVGADVPPPVPPGRPCGIRMLVVGGGGS